MSDIDVIPAIIEQDWDSFCDRVAQAAPYASWIHVYVSDGSIGIERTLVDFSRLSELVDRYPNCSFEAHILAAYPEKFVRSLADFGFTRLIAHVESNDPRRFLDEVKFDDVEVGLALDGASEIELIEPFLEAVDFVVVMTKETGVTGDVFLPEGVEKVKLIRQNFPDLPIEVVGGINDVTVKSVIDAGATRIVSSEFIFKDPARVGEAVETLRAG